MFRHGLVAALACALLLAAAPQIGAQTAVTPGPDPVPPGNATHGRALFMANGCYECHDDQGQAQGKRINGQMPGPNLAPAPIQYRAFVAQLRKPRVAMPPYDATLLSDADLADIYAYLASQPPVKDARTIPLLAAVDTGSSAGVTRGREVFAQNCASCHGENGGGGSVGPSLLGERAKRDERATVALIKNPSAPMTKLYPGMLDDADVAAVAAYVQTLQK
jgi:mono/diheme cytochrome c family protein